MKNIVTFIKTIIILIISVSGFVYTFNFQIKLINFIVTSLGITGGFVGVAKLILFLFSFSFTFAIALFVGYIFYSFLNIILWKGRK